MRKRVAHGILLQHTVARLVPHLTSINAKAGVAGRLTTSPSPVRWRSSGSWSCMTTVPALATSVRRAFDLWAVRQAPRDPAAEVSQGPACARRAAGTPPPHEARTSSFVITIACSSVTSPRAALKSASTGLCGERRPRWLAWGQEPAPGAGFSRRRASHRPPHRRERRARRRATRARPPRCGEERGADSFSQRYLLAAPPLPRGRRSARACAGAPMEELDGRGAPRAGRRVCEVVLRARSISKTRIFSAARQPSSHTTSGEASSVPRARRGVRESSSEHPRATTRSERRLLCPRCQAELQAQPCCRPSSCALGAAQLSCVLHHSFREARGGAQSSRSRSRRRGAWGPETARRRRVPKRRGLQVQQHPERRGGTAENADMEPIAGAPTQRVRALSF